MLATVTPGMPATPVTAAMLSHMDIPRRAATLTALMAAMLMVLMRAIRMATATGHGAVTRTNTATDTRKRTMRMDTRRPPERNAMPVRRAA